MESEELIDVRELVVKNYSEDVGNSFVPFYASQGRGFNVWFYAGKLARSLEWANACVPALIYEVLVPVEKTEIDYEDSNVTLHWAVVWKDAVLMVDLGGEV